MNDLNWLRGKLRDPAAASPVSSPARSAVPELAPALLGPRGSLLVGPPTDSQPAGAGPSGGGDPELKSLQTRYAEVVGSPPKGRWAMDVAWLRKKIDGAVGSSTPGQIMGQVPQHNPTRTPPVSPIRSPDIAPSSMV